MACTDVQTIQAGNGTKTQFSFDFPYIFKSEIHVYFWNVTTKEYDEKLTTDATYPWQITDANPTIVEFTGTAPPAPTAPTDPGEPTVDNVKIRRITKVDDIRALFNPGSAIRSNDLNSNFEQLRYAIQESNCQGITDEVDQYLKDYYWDRYDNTLYAADTWVSNDTKIATTAALDARFQDEVNDTITKAELAAVNNVIPDDDVAVPTTGTVKDYVDHVVETDILVNSTGLSKTATGGQVTLGIAANSVNLDRIRSTDIVASGESNPNNNTTIATTAKIDDMIDAAITGDIAVDSTGLTVTDDGDGTITLGIGSNSVDLDRIKNDDIITEAEQDSGSPTPADSNIFTASAAAKRFDTFVQTGTPSASNYEVGKTWLQNDDDQTLRIWNGSTWLDVASGGAFRTQDKVIYVDKTGGDDSKTGHRISGPKLTIKAAIDDINADISTSIKTGGSGYTNGTYQDVPLTGGTTGSGLTADITVSGGAVTAVTDINASTLEEYQIGDILSASDSNLGSGGGSGFELEVTGGGDGMTVIVAAGVYQEAAPIQIKRRNVSIIGMALRSTIVHPTVATEKPSNAGNSALFELNSGSFIQNLTLTGMQASSSGTNSVDSDLPDKQGWNFAFYNNAFITKSPYIQNCTNFSDSQIDNSDLRAHRPRGGFAGDLTNAPTGGGMLIDGSVPKTTSPLRSMVADSYTHVGLNGPGILVTNNGYAQCTSSYAFFNKYHIKTLNGGQANLAASTTDFGEKALVADGKSTAAIFTATVNGAASSGDVTFDIANVTAGTGWFGSQTKPASNMLVTVNSVTYPILSSTVITGGHRVTISRPDPNNRSTNLGLNGAVADNAAVSFFLRSQIASSGHTMEYVGSGMDYDALPENGGVPDETKQITELNNGKVWTAVTDHNGKFKIGGNQTDDPFFEVDQQLGFVTIPSGSIAFNLVSDTTPQLGGDLDVNGNTITGLPTTPTSSTEATSKAYVDAQVGSMNDVVDDTTPQLGGNLDVNGFSITSASNGNVIIDPNGTGKVGINETSPEEILQVDGNIRLSSTNQYLKFAAGNTQQSGLLAIAGDPSNNRAGINFQGVASSQTTAITFSTSDTVTTMAERMRIQSNGNVGIGTSSADAKLHVNGGNLIVQNSSGNAIELKTSVSNGNDSTFRFLKSRGGSGTIADVQNGDDLGTLSWGGYYNGAYQNDATIRAEALISGGSYSDRLLYDSDYHNFRTNNTSRLFIDDTGNVGIGTSSPASPLHVSSDVDEILKLETPANQTGNIYQAFYDATGVIGSVGLFSGMQELRVNNLQSDGVFVVRTANTERMRIDSNGNVGIGTTNPGAMLDIRTPAGTDCELTLNEATTSNPFTIKQTATDARIQTGASQPVVIAGQNSASTNSSIQFETRGVERMRIMATGQVGIGTTNPGQELEIASGSNVGLRFRDTSGSYSQIVYNDNGSSTSALTISCDTGNNRGSSDIRVAVDGNEHLRVMNDGSIRVNQSSTDTPGASNTTQGLAVESVSGGCSLFVSRGGNIPLYVNRNSNGKILSFRRSGTEEGYITIDTTAISLISTSDYRLKENAVSIADGITRVKQLQPKRFNFISDPSKTVDGFMAHEVQPVVPEAAFGEHDAVDAEGNPEYQGLDQSKLIPLLTAALQEAIAKIETLETKVAALEAG